MARETIKSLVYRSTREGLSIKETWEATQAAFPYRIVSWGYITRLRKHIAEGDRIAEAFADLMKNSRAVARR